MAEERTNKCAHGSCSCTVEKEGDYCSEYCREARDVTEIGCGCEHPACRL